MKTVTKYTRWNEEDRRTLALIVKRGLDKKSTVQNACAYAAKKLGRTRQGCEFQWHHWIKNTLDTYLAPTVVAPTEEVVTTVTAKSTGSDFDIDKTMLIHPSGERFDQDVVEATQEVKLPTIEIHSTMNSEVCEILAHADGTVIARASRGLIIVIKQ
jgi:hypothetical protein